ncbi:hypothetical protein FPV67DRAFT_1502059 [Lyophyllum atratum]|nr:hypothetical protein FPV67DRAFT_1502059 [Lyophyllum atratum]
MYNGCLQPFITFFNNGRLDASSGDRPDSEETSRFERVRASGGSEDVSLASGDTLPGELPVDSSVISQALQILNTAVIVHVECNHDLLDTFGMRSTVPPTINVAALEDLADLHPKSQPIPTRRSFLDFLSTLRAFFKSGAGFRRASARATRKLTIAAGES